MIEQLSKTLREHVISQEKENGYGSVPKGIISLSSLALGCLMSNDWNLEISVPQVVKAFNFTEAEMHGDTEFKVCTEEDATLVCTTILNMLHEDMKNYLRA